MTDFVYLNIVVTFAVSVRTCVGYAAAVINAAPGRTSADCCCVVEAVRGPGSDHETDRTERENA